MMAANVPGILSRIRSRDAVPVDEEEPSSISPRLSGNEAWHKGKSVKFNELIQPADNPNTRLTPVHSESDSSDDEANSYNRTPQISDQKPSGDQTESFEKKCGDILKYTVDNKPMTPQFKARILSVLNDSSGSESLLHTLIYRFTITPGHAHHLLLDLTRFITLTKPELLISYSDEKKTPLHLALEKCGRQEYRDTMVEVIKYMCGAASTHAINGQNYCQLAINCLIRNMTCLHYAISAAPSDSYKNYFDCVMYLVDCADAGTFTMRCGDKENTILHEVVGVTHKSKRLIEKIVNRNQDALLELNRDGYSPYRYFLGQPGIEKALGERRSRQENEDLDRSKKRGENPMSTNDSGLETKRSRNTERLSRIDKIERMLRERCLDRGNFHNTLKALYGNIEEHQGTWLNLLGIKFPVDFEEKLKFRRLDEHMVFVGLQVPETAATLSENPKGHPVVLFFNWLRSRKVKQILKVVIRDNQHSPCGDEIIELALKDLDVHYLDWDRPDISSKTILSACGNIRELSLYSTGRSAVIHGWESDNGLGTLPKLMTIHIVSTLGWDTIARTRSHLECLKEAFERSGMRNRSARRALNYQMRSHPAGRGHDSARMPVTLSNAKIHNWFRLVEGFIEGIGETDGPLEQKPSPKICVIDDGVDLNEDYIIEDGRSFGQLPNFSTSPGECFPSTNGHGTSMTRIIHQICPRARFYIAKLESAAGRGAFTMKDASRAIEWAMDAQVDIISMSWTIDDASQEDKKAMESAIHRKTGNRTIPIMFCASRDQGREIGERPLYPYASAPDLIYRIGAVDEYGGNLSMTPGDVDYLLPCQGLDRSSMDDSRKVTEGSSEATALAAGLAGLILLCEGATHGGEGIRLMRSASRMKLIFLSMTLDPVNGPKYISPRMFDEISKNAKRPSVLDRCAQLSRRCRAILAGYGEEVP